jgi:hypothetical protein
MTAMTKNRAKPMLGILLFPLFPLSPLFPLFP